MYLVRPPRDPRLAGLVDCLWWADGGGSVESDPERETKLPTGRGQLVIECGRASAVSAALVGPASKPTVIDSPGSTRAAGVSFTARGLRPFFRERSSELGDAQVALDALWGRNAAVAVEEIHCRWPRSPLRWASPIRPISAARCGTSLD